MRHAFAFIVLIFVATLNACSQTPADSPDNQYAELDPGTDVFIRIFKQESELEIWLKPDTETAYTLAEVFPICRWSGDLGPKLREGDGQSPEGFYRVRLGSLNPNSSYHLSFNLGFPNRYDRSHGRTGSYLMVHGACASIGCYAMTDSGIEKIYAAVENALENGQDAVSVHIFPFRMTDQAMTDLDNHPWADFWINLKQGYDMFEATKRVPKVSVDEKRYTFEEAL